MRKLAVIAILILCGCARHDNLPSALEVMEPPVPVGFSVTTDDYIDFYLSWQVDDPSVVSYFRIYVKSGNSYVRLPETTSDTSVIVGTGGVPVSGIVFCVSSVTTEGVESRLVCKSAD